jgi:hypothetical protein
VITFFDDVDALWAEVKAELAAVNYHEIMNSGDINQKYQMLHALLGHGSDLALADFPKETDFSKETAVSKIPLIDDYFDDPVKVDGFEGVMLGIRCHIAMELKKLSAQMFAELPHTAAQNYKKMFPHAEPAQIRASDEVMKAGGPWRHNECGTTFNVTPNTSPACPKCYSAAWDALVDQVWTGEARQVVSPDIELAPDKKIAFIDVKDWNGKCQTCGSLCYRGLLNVKCSAGCFDPK